MSEFSHLYFQLGFCKVVVDGLSRCMFRPTLLITIPAAFKDIAKDSPPTLPIFDAFNNDPKAIVARRVVELLESRQDADAIEDFIDSEHEGIDLAAEGDTWQVILLVQAIIKASNRLLSTLLTLLDTYRDLVRIFLDVEGGQEVHATYLFSPSIKLDFISGSHHLFIASVFRGRRIIEYFI